MLIKEFKLWKMADKPVKPEQVLKIEPKNELHFKGKFIWIVEWKTS